MISDDLPRPWPRLELQGPECSLLGVGQPDLGLVQLVADAVVVDEALVEEERARVEGVGGLGVVVKDRQHAEGVIVVGLKWLAVIQTVAGVGAEHEQGQDIQSQ